MRDFIGTNFVPKSRNGAENAKSAEHGKDPKHSRETGTNGTCITKSFPTPEDVKPFRKAGPRRRSNRGKEETEFTSKTPGSRNKSRGRKSQRESKENTKRRCKREQKVKQNGRYFPVSTPVR
ncbi:hypothetical protein AVEN_177317-1 [Araneus ventricosus]|uniref:Uncharacterized protein n=1 Tax=Araneus ventricosus TaxID=182803 RepID=A0A4Y2C7I7_ARAVE|nr:hypothetical protein AVEN_177317-1 [Araneus ventricosus]